MIMVTVRAWIVGVVALLAAGAGVSALAAGGAVTSSLRLAVAAGVLAAYTAVFALVTTPRAERSVLWIAAWGGVVPLLVGGGNAALVASTTDLTTGALTALPWVIGAILGCALGPVLPALRLPHLRRRSEP